MTHILRPIMPKTNPRRAIYVNKHQLAIFVD